MPVGLDPCRIIRANYMNGTEPFGHLDCQLVLPPANCIASTELIVKTGFHQVYKPNDAFVGIRSIFRRNVLRRNRSAQRRYVLMPFASDTVVENSFHKLLL